MGAAVEFCGLMTCIVSVSGSEVVTSSGSVLDALRSPGTYLARAQLRGLVTTADRNHTEGLPSYAGATTLRHPAYPPRLILNPKIQV